MKTNLTTVALLLFASMIPARALASPTPFSLVRSPAPEVRFTVDAPLDSIAGVSHAVSGTVVFDLDALELGPTRILADPKSFQTGISLRDEDLRDQFFEAASFPEIVLAVQKLTRFNRTTLAEGERLEAEAQALFTLHGVTRTVSFPVELRRSSREGTTALAVRGSFDVPLADYGIRRPTRLFLKLGEVAQVHFEATFLAQRPDAASPTLAHGAAPTAKTTTVAAASSSPPSGHPPSGPPIVARVPRRTAHKAPSGPTFAYPFNTPPGRGERLFYDASLGGAGNAVSCASCHSTSDERLGFLLAGGVVRPSRSLFNSAKRPSFWQGFAPNAGKAASLCARLFMLSPQGLDEGRQKDLQAYLLKLSPDAAPGLDYQTLALTRRSTLDNPTGGDARAGAKLTHRHCESCHAEGAMRPPLTPGLYESDYLVKRVRWQFGHDSRQMPPMYIDRLTDSELRDIVTYLVGDESQRVFKRNRPSHAESSPGARPGETLSTR